MLAHEVRNPLTVVRGFIQIARKYGRCEEQGLYASRIS
ncbi:histidine kinase dimerization/phospho-acceptor domain-containing protein [Bacillus cereus]